MSSADDPFEGFNAALREASAALERARSSIAGATIGSRAFGKLFEAGQVRDAYHRMLPETATDIDQAREVIAHFTRRLSHSPRPPQARTEPAPLPPVSAAASQPQPPAATQPSRLAAPGPTAPAPRSSGAPE